MYTCSGNNLDICRYIFVAFLPHTFSTSKKFNRLGFIFSCKGCRCSVVSDCDIMHCSTLGLPVPHSLPEFAQTPVHWYYPVTSSSIAIFSSCLQSFPASGSFPRSELFASGGQSTGASASSLVLPMSIQCWITSSDV